MPTRNAGLPKERPYVIPTAASITYTKIASVADFIGTSVLSRHRSAAKLRKGKIVEFTPEQKMAVANRVSAAYITGASHAIEQLFGIEYAGDFLRRIDKVYLPPSSGGDGDKDQSLSFSSPSSGGEEKESD